MEKVKMTAKQAQEVTKTTGKEWLLNTIFKTIRQAAERGEDKITWDFTPNFGVADEVKTILRDIGYAISENGDVDDFACEISWEYGNFADFVDVVFEKQNDFSQSEKEDFTTAISSAEKLTHIVKAQGRMFLFIEARKAIMQAAYVGRDSAMVDLSDVPDCNINWLFEQLGKDGFKVSYISDGPAAKISL